MGIHITARLRTVVTHCPLAAARARRNVAFTLTDAGRPTDALEYARAALRGFQGYGERAAERIQGTQQLIARIQSALP
jgi:hypothetical protein